MEYLTNDIVQKDELFNYPTGTNQFKVLGLEAGVGKSRYTDSIIKSYIEDNAFNPNSKKFLVVKKFNSEAKHSADFINNTNWFCGNEAVAVDRDNWKEYWQSHLEELKNVQAIFISHARYINLSSNELSRKQFTEGREILIIDEKIQFQPLIYRDSLYSKVREIIDIDYRKLLDSVCEPLTQYINEMNKEKKYRQVAKIRFDCSQQVEELIEYLNGFIKINTLTTKDRNLIEALCNGLPNWYENMNIYNYHNIATNNSGQGYWGLEGNNIILDASANLDGVYKVNKSKFKIINMEKIINHSQSEFHMYKFNTSKTNVKKDKDVYLKEIIEKAVSASGDGQKTLLIGYRDLADDVALMLHEHVSEDCVWTDKKDKDKDLDYNDQSFAISWYGNLVGRNEFRVFDNIWLLTTPNLPMNHYPIHYMQYKSQSIGQRKLNIKNGRFKNSVFNDLHRGYVRSEVYQSLKRIQRTAKPLGTFHIVVSDEELIHTVLQEMNGAILPQENLHTLKFVEEKKKKQEENKIVSKGELVSEYLLICNEKEVTKSDLKKEFAITNWHKQVAMNPSFINLKNTYQIKESSNKRSIIII
ncbi:hypothetical protein [Paraliobacillus sp. X-1268]|uniref:hypothetical protein n=1 Tax=Paraliobacillus sp. X-1268 TaxID=2213193 RepID=UPI000E3DC6A3|nr:hypothetical protein [Paraliobacillus sp. X-1268]